MADSAILTRCKLNIPVYACIVGQSVHSCNLSNQNLYACNVRDWVWFDTSDYYIYGYSRHNRYSYLKESGYRVY